jgi:hypothetical protein
MGLLDAFRAIATGVQQQAASGDYDEDDVLDEDEWRDLQDLTQDQRKELAAEVSQPED